MYGFDNVYTQDFNKTDETTSWPWENSFQVVLVVIFTTGNHTTIIHGYL